MEKMTFTGGTNVTLSAKIDKPDGEIKAYALYAHCFTCNKDVFAASRIAKTLKEQGIATLRFDFSGLGQSEGIFADTNFTTNVMDLMAAAEFMATEMEAPKLIIGHSLGGAAVLAAAGHIKSVKGVITLGAPAEVAHVGHHFDAAKDEIMQNGAANVDLQGRPFIIKRQFIEDITSVSIEENVRNMDKALLVMHAPLDETVGVENAAQIFGWAKHPKSYVSLDDADHLITRKEDGEYAAGVIAAWARKYI